jgi:hypothetical protein
MGECNGAVVEETLKCADRHIALVTAQENAGRRHLGIAIGVAPVMATVLPGAPIVRVMAKGRSKIRKSVGNLDLM